MSIVGLILNATISTAYAAIGVAVLLPLLRSRQLRSNRLGAATALIFFTCSAGHAVHAEHLLLPALGVGSDLGPPDRHGYHWHLALADVVTAAVGLYYWTLRATYAGLMHGAVLFDDLRERQRQALLLNDEVLQSLTTAGMALELGQHELAEAAVEAALDSTRMIMRGLLAPSDRAIAAGELVHPGTGAAP